MRLQAPPYQVDASNQNILRETGTLVKTLSVTSEISQLQKNKFHCRGLFSVGMGDQSVLQFVEKSLNDELLAADKLSNKGKVVHVDITRLQIFTFTDARWEVDAVIHIDDAIIPLSHSRKMAMGLGELSDGLRACSLAKVEFIEFVKEFNREVISKLAETKSKHR